MSLFNWPGLGGFITGGHSNVAKFNIAPHDRYHVRIQIRDKGGQMQTITLLADSGNDLTLLRNSTARKLGFDPQSEPGEVFPVGGITGGPQQFKKIVNLIQIGNLTPMMVHMGLAYQDKSLAEDLLGRSDIFDSGKLEVDYGKDYVIFKEKEPMLDITTSSYNAEQLPSKLRFAFRHAR